MMLTSIIYLFLFIICIYWHGKLCCLLFYSKINLNLDLFKKRVIYMGFSVWNPGTTEINNWQDHYYCFLHSAFQHSY